DALFLETDVRQEAQIEKLIAAAIARWKRIHVAVNNAGTEGRFAPLQDIIAVNLRGMFLGLKHEIPHMKANGGGAIVNMSSNAGLKAIANIAVYTASKHGVAGLTKAAALETARDNIRVNAVAPGAVETGLLHRMVDGHVPIPAIAESTPMGRISQPEEIARTILFLASDSASYMTGVIVPIDGGGIAG